MALEFLVPIVFGIVLWIAHHLSERLHLNFPKHREKLLSFTAGISISYIFLFLFLFPEIYIDVAILNRLLFIFVLIGFSFFHIIEKHAYMHKSREKLRKELKGIHSISFFLYHFVIGILLVNLALTGFAEALLFFIPVFFHTISSSVSLKEIHEHIKRKTVNRHILASSTILGVLFAIAVPLSPFIYNMFLGFVVGALIYVVIRDSLPKKGAGDPHYFIIGVLVYVILLFMIFT